VRNRFHPCAALAVCLSVTWLSGDAAAQRGSLVIPRVSIVYVSAVDRNGVPATDLTVQDFVLKEGGDIREIVKVQRATAPLHIALIIDDSGTGIFRFAVANFVDQMLGRAQFAIKRVVGQVLTLVDYTADIDRLRQAVGSLKVMTETPKGGQIVEGIFEASKELQRRAVERPVIVVFTDTDAEYSTLPAAHVLNQLADSGAVLYVISVAKMVQGVLPNSGVVPDKPSDLLDKAVDVNQVLGDGPKQSGGRRAEIIGTAGSIPVLQQIGDELKYQYVITYIVPAGEKPNQKLSVSTKRKGISIHAPSRSGGGTP
jgi:VWFA-related protein